MDLSRLVSQYDDFEYCYPSITNVAIVKKDNKVGLIDEKFNILIPFIYEMIYLVKYSSNRMIVQRNDTWFVIDYKNNILYESKYNYNRYVKYKMSCFDKTYCYVAYYDGYIEHFKDKIVLITKNQKKEFYIESDSAMCVDNTSLVYFFNGEVKGCLNLEKGSVELDILLDVRKEFQKLKAYNLDKKVSIGVSPYSLFEQDIFIQELKDNGVTTLINLMSTSEIKYSIKLLKKEFKMINISIYEKHLPMQKALREIVEIIEKNAKTYIYCDLGVKRLGIVVAYYFYSRGFGKTQRIFQQINELRRYSIFCSTELKMSKEEEKFILELDRKMLL